MNEEWVKIDEVSGSITAEILRGLLEASDITVWLNQEGVGHVYGIEIPIMGIVQILTPASQAERARQLLDDYYQGKLEVDEP